MKKGFTLIEMLGSIVILAIVVAAAFPAVLNMIGSSQKKLDDSMKSYAISACAEYVNDNINDFPKQDSLNKNVDIFTLKQKGYISDTKINDNKNSEMLDDNITVKYNGQKYTYEYNEES